MTTRRRSTSSSDGFAPLAAGGAVLAGGTRTLALNPAQSRNLRNWAKSEWPDRTVTFVLTIPSTVGKDQVIEAVADLVRAHEGLRSRLATDSSGKHVQEVLPEDSGTALLPDLVQVVEAADAAEITREPIAADPAEGAFRGILYLRQGRAAAIKLSISHVFADSLGRQAASRHLSGLLSGQVGPDFVAPRQASEFASEHDDPQVVRSTEYWKKSHVDAPRACVFASMRRAPNEWVDIAQVSLSAADSRAFDEICRELGASPHAAWIALMSIVVSRLSGNDRLVFKTTMANRLRRADLSAVAQLAQPVFPTIAGGQHDTIRDWMMKAERSLAPATRHGMYDANELLDWLNRGDGFNGVIFQPAFELNYLPPAPREEAESLYGGAGELSFTEPVRIDPYAAKPELALAIRHFPQTSLRVLARRTVSTQIRARAIAEHLRSVVRVLSSRPDTLVSTLPIPQLPGVDGLLCGHASGARVDLSMTRSLVAAASGRAPTGCAVRAVRDHSGFLRIHAELPVEDSVDVSAIRARMRELLPWFGAAVLPDELVLA